MSEMWLTRDKDNDLYLFIGTEKPKKAGEQWFWVCSEIVKMDNNLFPEVQWNDKEPTKVKLIIEK